MIKISTSILSSNNRIESIKKLNNTQNDYLHIDVMDGKFVPNKQFTIEEINEIISYSHSPLDIHLMTENPIEYITELKSTKIAYITIHLEIQKDLNNLIKKIKELNYKVGISIKPNTNLDEIIPYISDIDLILIMSVEPGFGGQKFLPNSIERIKKIKELNPDITIEVDGGINIDNIDEIKKYADIAVVGSYIINSNDYNQAINNLKN